MADMVDDVKNIIEHATALQKAINTKDYHSALQHATHIAASAGSLATKIAPLVATFIA
jgi:hypothetical protein